MDYVPENKPFYPDTNVSPSAFLEDTLLIREMFITIQGEMPFAGTPSLFVRLGGCNRGAKVDIGCNACDTDFRMSYSKVYSIEDAAAEMKKILQPAPKIKLIVITGGEPMLQSKALKKLLPLFASEYIIQFETNGDFVPGWESIKNQFFVVSPKFPHKKNPWWLPLFDGRHVYYNTVFPKSPYDFFERRDYKIPVEKFFLRQVVSSTPGSPYFCPSYLEKMDRDRERVFISPQTAYTSEYKNGEPVVDQRKTQNNIYHAMRLCNTYGFRLSLQSHVFAGIR